MNRVSGQRNGSVNDVGSRGRSFAGFVSGERCSELPIRVAVLASPCVADSAASVCSEISYNLHLDPQLIGGDLNTS